jgi:membrane dipeptidase
VACVNFYPTFLVSDGPATLEHLLDHFDRFLDIAGPDHVGLGTDFDGIPTGPDGIEDVTDLPCVTMGLLDRGHTEATVEKVLGANLLRLFDS